MLTVHLSLCLVQPLPKERGLVLEVGPLGQAGLERGLQLLSLERGSEVSGGGGRGREEEEEEEGRRKV